MSDPQPQPSRPPLHSLATKIIVFVFLSTLATALILSWISIESTSQQLSEQIERRHPLALENVRLRIEHHLAEHAEPGTGLAGLPEATAVELMSRDRPNDAARVHLVDPSGRVRASTGGGEAPQSIAIPKDAGGAVREYTNDRGLHVIGVSRPIGDDGWSLVVETPFDSAYAPVLDAITRIFIVDVVIVLLFSWLAYRITGAVVKPVEELSEAARRIAQGDFDHDVPEPDTRDEIGLLARTINDMMRRLRGYQGEIEAANFDLMERNAQLQQAKEMFEQLSITDGLTKVHNHRFFQDHLSREIKRVMRTGEPLSILLIDIDDFKSFNDRHGHASGDEILVGLARIMNESIRDSDLLARYGGEEFAVLTSGTDQIGAYKLAEKIRTSIAEASFVIDESMRPVRLTVSVGVAQFAGDRKTFFIGADQALYRAKAQGKNCVVMDVREHLP
jgi:diguanylate cyclase (GGDEF)-like protein